MRIGIGIDTGGTYTDAVMYDFETQTIMGSAKALTTKSDLTIGILGALDGLPAAFLKAAEIIALSTTLATNACVEGKGGRAKLIFLGGDARIIDELGGKYGLPPAKDIHIQPSYTTFAGEIEREVDWDAFDTAIRQGFDGLDGAGIIEMNAVRNGAVIEKKARAIFEARHGIPVICGHELFSELNSLQRGASTLLNAELFPVIKEFLVAIERALQMRDMQAALVIVRSDGSLMSEAFASVHPVETLLCGPAASTIGGTCLTDSPDSIVIDMGGTTTDIALVRGGRPVTVTDGIAIGKWKTYVDGLYIKTVGLGGDSAIHYDDRQLYLDEQRVMPLCIAAHSHPSIIDSLRALQVRKHTRYLYEHFVLVRDISGSAYYTQTEKDFCEALKDAPLSITDAAAAIHTDLYNLRMERLIKDGVVQLCGLTPTDIMHIRGDYGAYDAEASSLAATFVAHNLGISVDALCERVYDEVKRKLYISIVKALLENREPKYQKSGFSQEIEGFIVDCYEAARAGARDPMLSMMFSTTFTLVGIGAPIHIFIEDVAQMLGTGCVVPEHHEVANALGAIIGNVNATHTLVIRPCNTAGGTSGYTVMGIDGNHTFETLEDAEAFALAQAEAVVREKAMRQGARGEIAVTHEVRHDEGEARDCMIYLGTDVTARAVGAMGFSGRLPQGGV